MRERIRNGAATAIAAVCIALAVEALFVRQPAPITEAALGLPPSGFVFLVGLAMLVGIAGWVGRGQAGETLRPLALPMAAATSASSILLPVFFSDSGVPLYVAALVLPTIAVLPLADGFLERIADRTRRRVAAIGAAVAAIAGLAVTLAVNVGLVPLEAWIVSSPWVSPWFWLGLALWTGITLIPAAFLLGRRPPAEDEVPSADRRRSSGRLPILLAAVTPMVIGTTYGYDHLGFGLTLPIIWLLIAVVVLQTKVRFESLRNQRDMVVAATEVERARLAADLHDDALQEMTILVRRLDRAGDTQSAELARSIADRLREVCGDLRLPILDELGAGSALEWLVARVGETSGRLVRLEREDTSRPPADVELAVFRVAQEALSNAVTHGAPPILVRYDAAANRATLSITDRGTGIPTDAATIANRSGHYGLLNMRQRAEQIGATFEVRQPADGGTTIGLSWSSA